MAAPHFSLSLSHVDHGKTIQEAKKIVGKLRPNWLERMVDESGQDAMNFEFFTEGITNTILSVWNRLIGPNDRVLIRIYGEKTELLIDRDTEKKNMAFLNRFGCAAPLYGTFDNGVIYGYVPGRVLNRNDVRDPHLSDLIAKQMAKMHVIGLLPNAETDRLLEQYGISREPVLIPKLSSFIQNMPTDFDDPKKQKTFEKFPTKEELLKEFASVREKIQELHSPVVCCHNDLLVKNLIYEKEKDTVTFIDYEYAGYNYQAFDIGDHFCEFAGVEEVDFSLYPDEKFQRSWLKNYLKHWRQFSNKTPPTDQDVDVLYVQVNAFAAMAHFMWSVWAIIQGRYSTIDFDFLQYGIDRYNEYKKLKNHAWPMKIPK